MLNTRKIAAAYRLSHWAQVLQERAQSGLSIKAYCQQLGICSNTYFYWQRRVRATAANELGPRVCDEANPPQVSFSAVSVAEKAGYSAVVETVTPRQLHIGIGDIHLAADSSYPVEKLAALLRELSRPC